MKIEILQKQIEIPKRRACRTCGAEIVDFFDFGYMPLAGAFLKYDDAIEYLYPMQASFCPNCTLVQIPNVISKDIFFNENYHYFSSVTETLNRHFEGYAAYLQWLTAGLSDSIVFEFGCNDGVLLSKLRNRDIRCIGMDASANVAEAARRHGLDVRCGFFSAESACELLKTSPHPSIITGSNVFAHNDDVEKILEGVKVLLRKDGFFIVEVHYVAEVIKGLQFDFFYHEHCNYYSLHSIKYLLNKFGLEVVDVHRLSLHGGSIRVISQFRDTAREISLSVAETLREEKALQLDSLDTYTVFAGRIKSVKEDLLAVLHEKKSKGMRICGYGASGRSVTMLNYMEIGADILDFMIDASAARANHVTPGIHVPIYDPEKFRHEKSDVCLITAWPYAKEIIGKEGWYLNEGGTFIVPLPDVKEIRK